MNDRVYRTVNNGVYRAGFAGTQAAYDRAVHELFDTLDALELHLRTRRWLVGNVFTEADLRLFPTLVRFDAVYHCHFKCNRRMLREYPALFGWTRDIYQLPGVRQTIDFPDIRRHYFFSHRRLNPLGVIPVGADLDFSAPTGRSVLGPSPLAWQ